MGRIERKKNARAAIAPELVAQAKAGSQEAFAALYQQTQGELYRTIHSMVRDEELAKDIQQDTYLKAFQNLERLQSNEAFLVWLRRIAVHQTAERMKQRMPVFAELEGQEGEGLLAELPELRPEAQPELAMDRQETARLVREILAELPEGQQTILGMRYYEEMSVREIAELLHLSEGTVKAQLHQGRKKVEAAVRSLEQKGIKLYGLSPMGYLLALLQQARPSAGVQKQLAHAVLSNAASHSGRAVAVTMSAKGTGASLFLAAAGKIAAVVLGLALTGGAVFGLHQLKKEEGAPLGDHQPESTAKTVMAAPEDIQAPVPALAESEIRQDFPEEAPLSGSCGEDLTWRFDPETGTLHIEGSGEMARYNGWREEAIENCAPWYPIRSWIRQVEFPEGLVSIGSFAFQDCTGLRELSLPEQLTAIGDSAFQNCTALQEISLPEALSALGVRSFCGCKALRTVHFPAKLETILEEAFAACESLEEISLPQGLTCLEATAFSNCTSLMKFSISDENPDLSVKDGVLFSKDQGTLIAYPVGREGAYTIPAGVDTIGMSAFNTCAGLTEVVLPDGLTTIEGGAFFRCTGLREISFPDSLTSIGWKGFYGCAGLREISFPDSLTSIGYGAFSDCTGLKEILFPAGLTSIGYGAFSDCTGLESVVLPEQLTDYDPSVFLGCRSLTGYKIEDSNPDFSVDDGGALLNKDKTVLIDYPCGRQGAYSPPDSLVSIGSRAFFRCTGLTQISFPEGLASIGAFAFVGSGLNQVIVPASVTEIAEAALGHNSAEQGITGAPVDGFTIYGFAGTAAEDYAEREGFRFVDLSSGEGSDPASFEGRELLSGSCGEDLTWRFDPETGTLHIEGSGEMKLFGVCSAPWWDLRGAIREIAFSEEITSIAPYAFYDCPMLTEVTLPRELSSPGDHVFTYCENLTAFHISEENPHYSVDDCGVLFNKEKTELIFYPSGRVGSYTVPSSVTKIWGNSFMGCSRLTEIEFPEGLRDIGAEAFNDCTGLTEIYIPDGVTEIGQGTFGGCTGLRRVHLPQGLTTIESGGFYGCTGLTEIGLPEGLTTIEYCAFGDCPELKHLVIPASVTHIAGFNFGHIWDAPGYRPIEGFTVYGYEGTVGEVYARECGFAFIPLEDGP